ncbi:hypothetical protein D3C78_1869380 [compost metagenome]
MVALRLLFSVRFLETLWLFATVATAMLPVDTEAAMLLACTLPDPEVTLAPMLPAAPSNAPPPIPASF